MVGALRKHVRFLLQAFPLGFQERILDIVDDVDSHGLIRLASLYLAQRRHDCELTGQSSFSLGSAEKPEKRSVDDILTETKRDESRLCKAISFARTRPVRQLLGQPLSSASRRDFLEELTFREPVQLVIGPVGIANPSPKLIRERVLKLRGSLVHVLAIVANGQLRHAQTFSYQQQALVEWLNEALEALLALQELLRSLQLRLSRHDTTLMDRLAADNEPGLIVLLLDSSAALLNRVLVVARLEGMALVGN